MIWNIFPQNPNLIDNLFIYLLPAGLLTFLFNVILVIMGFLTRFIVRKSYGKKDADINPTKIDYKIYLIALFIVPVAVYIFNMDIIKSANTIFSRSKNWIIKILGIIGYLLIIICPIASILYGIYVGNLYLMVHLLMGCIYSYIIIVHKKLWNISLFKSLNSVEIANTHNKIIKRSVYIVPLIFIIILTMFYGFKSPKTVEEYTHPTESTQIRIITYNIRLPANEKNPANNWDVRKSHFVDYLQSLEADIIGVQEAYHSQLMYVVQNLNNEDYRYTGQGRNDGTFGGEHSAILFRSEKFTLLDSDTFWLSSRPKIPSMTWGNEILRVSTWARFEYRETGAQFFVFNTHFDFSNPFQTNAAKLLIKKINEFTADLPVFLMGDFNLVSSEEAYKYLENYGEKPLQDSFSLYYDGNPPFDYSINRFNPTYIPEQSRRIDFIFISSHIQPTFTQIPKDTYNEVLYYSDHFPVILDCVF